jgi:hypothetical protein
VISIVVCGLGVFSIFDLAAMIPSMLSELWRLWMGELASLSPPLDVDDILSSLQSVSYGGYECVGMVLAANAIVKHSKLF